LFYKFSLLFHQLQLKFQIYCTIIINIRQPFYFLFTSQQETGYFLTLENMSISRKAF